MKLYTETFARSWNITKRNPVLWLLGVFIVFWSDRSVDIEQAFSSAKLFRNAWSPFRPEFWDISRWAALIQKITAAPQMFAPFVIIFLVLGIFVVVLMTAAHVSVIDAHNRAMTSYTFHDAVQSTEKNMRPALLIQVLNKAVMYLCVALSSIPFFVHNFGGWSGVVASLVLLCTLPLTIMISIVAKYALVAVVTQHMHTLPAIQAGWKTFRNNVGVSIEMALLMMLAYAALNFGSIVAALVLLSPIFIGAVFILITSQIVFPLFIHSLLLTLFSVFFVIASGAVFSAWHLGNWTLLYAELQHSPRRSKTYRLLKKEKTTV